jgi:hypothetical protein
MNNLLKFKVLTLILFIAYFLYGCLGTDDEQNTVSLRVIDSSYSGVAKELTLDTKDYSAINVSIIRIELTGDGTVVVFVDYGTDPLLINLLDLGNAGTLLISDAEIPVGNYNKIRMILDAPEEQNQIPVNPSSFLTIDGDVTEHPIFIPSGAQTGLKINLQPLLGLIDGSSFEVVLDFNSENTIKKTGQNDRYIIRPTSMNATVTDNS